MSDRVQIVITATNGTQQVFNAIAADSTKMGDAIKRSSQVADQSMQGVGASATQMGETIESSSARSSASYEKIGNAIGKFGLAFGALSLVASKANADAEASQARLSASIAATGGSFDDYAVKIKAAADAGLQLGFDDEDLQNSISQLIQATGNVGKSITDMGLAEDIARGRGIALADAARLVGLAEQGRTGTLIRLGIQIDKNATSEEALAALQGRYAGQAEAYSKTTAASWDRVKNSIENAAESAGSHLASLQMPIIALSSSAAALGPLVGELKTLAAEGALLDIALGPVGLAAAALAAGAGIFYLFNKTHEYTSAASAATTQSIDLNNALVILASTSSPVNKTIIDQLNEDTKTLLTTSGEATDRIAGLTELMSRMGASADAPGGALNSLNLLNDAQMQAAESATHMTAAQLHAMDADHDQIVTYNEMRDAINGVIPAISSLAGLSHSLSAPEMNKFTADFKTLIELPNANIPAISAAIEGLIQQFESGAISSADFVKGMDALTADVKPFVLTVNAATSATQGNTTAVSANGTAIAAQMALYASQNQSLGQAIDFTTKNTDATVDDTAARLANANAIAAQMALYDKQNSSLNSAIIQQQGIAQLAADLALGKTMGVVSDAIDALDTSTKNAAPDTKEYSQYLDEQAQAAANAAKEVDNYRSKLGEVHMVVNDGVNQFAKHATVSGNALDSGNRVIIGNTNAIASASQGVADWGAKLINVKGTLGEIDTLSGKIKISSDEYAAAQSAETSIFHNNAAIQRDILKIQIDQSPVMAGLLKQERDYMDVLAVKPAAEQLVALGYMDQAESAKALAAQQLALSAASGELGKTGVATANKMIQAAAEADPVLKAMLVDMGLITVGSDGTITVHFGDVTESKDEMILLLDKIGDLITLLEQEFGIKVDHGDVDASYQMTHDLNDQLDHLQGRQISYSVAGTYTVTGDQGSSAAGAGTGNESIGVGAGQGPRDPGGSGGDEFGSATGARLGGVMGYARGGVVIEAAEAGAELMHFANGGTALARYRGLYNVPHGTYVDTAPATNAKLQRMGGHYMHIENLTVIANDSREFVDSMRAFEMAASR